MPRSRRHSGRLTRTERRKGDTLHTMYLKELHITGFKSFGRPVTLTFSQSIVGIVGPNGSGKSNIAEAFRFVLGEQSMKSLRGKRGEDLIFNGGGRVAPEQPSVSIPLSLTTAAGPFPTRLTR